MAENKTKPTNTSVTAFVKKIQDDQRRADCTAIIGMMQTASKCEPVMWGSAIIGFGTRHYVHPSGREGDTMILGLSPRKQAFALYLAGGLDPLRKDLAKLGKHTTGKGCLYLKSLEGVDENILSSILTKSYLSAI